MKVIYELKSIEYFDAWEGGKETLDTVIKAGKVAQLDQLLEDYVCEDDNEIWKEGGLNDFLWFQRDYIYDMLGIENE